jgi:hypothetical protein
MSLKKNYGKSFRKQLAHFPVWEPGSEVAVGDYGSIHDNCFFKLGNLSRDFGIEFQVKAASAHAWQFQSEGVRSERATVSGKAGDLTTNANGKLKLLFGETYSLYIRSAESWLEEIPDLAQLFSEIDSLYRRSGIWKRSNVIVSALRRARPITLFMSTGMKSEVDVDGSLSLLDALETGQLKTSAGLGISGEAGFSIFGAEGAISVDLVKLGIFGGGKAMLPAETEHSFVSLDPTKNIE